MRVRLLSLLVLLSVLDRVAAQQIVVSGDYPDPSVVKIGNTYWASATSSNWMPALPLLKSKNLLKWESVGAVFPTLPAWADYYFWAPEISYENGKVYIYYSAHKKGGNLCVGVASADRPEGPYKDHGPLVCEPAGSIDAFPMRDEQGKLYLIWKEDGNSVGKPTPIWCQQMNEERTALLGEKKELFRNQLPWEQNLVEGVSMVKHGNYFYAFYAAAGCCGVGCTYQSGVARAKNLLGPWEKFSGNPILVNERNWKCSGHGTPVAKDGRYYFLYHAYDTAGSTYVGRQVLLKEFVFTNDGWLQFVQKDEIQEGVKIPEQVNTTDAWQWSVFQNPERKIEGKKIELGATPSVAFIAQRMYKPNSKASVIVNRKASAAAAGIAVVGDDKNMIYATVRQDSVFVIQLKNGVRTTLVSAVANNSKNAYLGVDVQNGMNISFFYGKNENKAILLNTTPANGTFLPPWDRGIRIGVVAEGQAGTKASFSKFSLR